MIRLRGTVRVVTTADQVILTDLTSTAGGVEVLLRSDTPLRLSDRGSHAVQIVVTVYDCTLQDLGVSPDLLLHGRAGGLPRMWHIPLIEPLRRVAEAACHGQPLPA